MKTGRVIRVQLECRLTSLHDLEQFRPMIPLFLPAPLLTRNARHKPDNLN
jgi:hypothetical protein